MSKSFSQRYGYRSIKNTFQTESMDENLKTGIWNSLLSTCLDGHYNLNKTRIKNSPN